MRLCIPPKFSLTFLLLTVNFFTVNLQAPFLFPLKKSDNFTSSNVFWGNSGEATTLKSLKSSFQIDFIAKLFKIF